MGEKIGRSDVTDNALNGSDQSGLPPAGSAGMSTTLAARSIITSGEGSV